MAGLGGPYATKAQVVDFLNKSTSSLHLSESDISDIELGMATNIINQRTDTYWEIFAGDIFVDGKGEPSIFCPIVPIVTLTGLKIIAVDDTQETIILTGINKQVKWDSASGLIKRIETMVSDIERNTDVYDSAIFPIGLNNIKLTGTFGNDGLFAETLCMLQIILIAQLFQKKYPGKYNTDLISEKIGEYEYRNSEMQYSKDVKNQKLTLEGYIEYLFSTLPNDGKMTVLAV